MIPAIVEIVDIAGLVKGASQGEGLGNKFLANIRETNAILMMVRCFEDPNVIHVAGSVDPMRDIDIIELELALADVDSVEKRAQEGAAALAKTGNKEAKIELALAEKVLRAARGGQGRAHADAHRRRARSGWRRSACSPPSRSSTAATSARPTCPTATRGATLVQGARAEPKAPASSSCAARSRPSSPSWTRRIAPSCSQSYGLDEPALATLARECYRLLGLQSYFTAGEKEVRAWTIRKGAHRARGGRRDPHRLREGLHPRAGLLARRSRAASAARPRSRPPARCAWKARSTSSQDGDIMHFLFNV